jgi:ABC-2 type transport system permease protein
MRREGSPLTGVGVVLAKEPADYLSGARMWLIETLVFLTAIGAAYAAILSIRATIGESPFLFLRLFTMAQDPLPSLSRCWGF